MIVRLYEEKRLRVAILRTTMTAEGGIANPAYSGRLVCSSFSHDKAEGCAIISQVTTFLSIGLVAVLLFGPELRAEDRNAVASDELQEIVVTAQRREETGVHNGNHERAAR
jgi:hypothetical protein